MMFKFIFSLSILSVTVTSTHSFSISTQSGSGNDVTKRLPRTLLFQSSSSPGDEGEKRRISNEEFLEEASRSGYDKVKTMSIEERTRRVMLAEAAEDRVVMLSDELDKLLGDDGMPAKVEDREEVTILATQIKASMEQYKKLVNGDDCASLDLFSSPSSGDGDSLDLQ